MLLSIGGAAVVGGALKFADQRTGTSGKAHVTSCTGHNGKYSTGVPCRGSWIVGGSLVGGNGRVVVGPVEGADYSDVGKTIAVRIHGDHATVPSIWLPIVLIALGLPFVLLGLLSIRNSRRSI